MSALNLSTALNGGMQSVVGPQAPAMLQANPAHFDTSANSDPAARRLFASHPLLTSLSACERTDLMRWSRLRALDRHELIWRQGNIASNVVFLLDGHVKLCRQLAEGAETILEIVGPRACLGDMAVMGKRPHDTTAATLSPCRLLQIDGRHFRQIFERHIDGLLALLNRADERLQTLSESLADARGLSAAARLAKVLVRLARFSCEPVGETHLPIQLSQRELGALSGMCREFVCRYLRSWRNAGWIQMLGGAVVSLHVPALAKLCDECPNSTADARHLSAWAHHEPTGRFE